MAEYIDKAELRKAMYHESFEKDSDLQRWDNGCWIRYKLFENVIDSIPTADVAPVVHGKWIEQNDYNGDTYYECSCCEEPYILIDGTPMDNWYNYCPNCGARMDGGT